MALAHELGKTLSEVGEMDVQELALWAAWLAQGESIAGMRADWRAGMIASVVANCHSDKGRFQPADFMPRRADESVMDEERAKKHLMAWAAAFGGKTGSRV